LKGVSFFLIPLYTSVLTPTEYGQIELLNNASTILTVLFTFGLVPIFGVEYFRCKNHTEKIKLLNQIIGIYLIVSTSGYLITLFLVLKYFSLVFGSEIKIIIVVIVLITSYLTFYQSMFFTILQLDKKSRKLTINKVVIGLIIAILNIYLIYYLKIGVMGYFLTNLIAMSLSAGYGGYEYFNKIKRIEIEISWRISKDHLINGFPFIIGSLSFWLLSGIDRWIVLKYLGQADVGIYSIAVKFASLYDALLITPVLLVYGPYIYERFANKNYNQKIKLITFITLLIFSLLAIITPIIANFMINKNFSESLIYISYLVIGYGFYFLSQITGQLAVFHKRKFIIVSNVFLSSVVNVAANIILIPAFHLMGTVIAFVFSYFFWFILSWYQTYVLRKKLLLDALSI